MSNQRINDFVSTMGSPESYAQAVEIVQEVANFCKSEGQHSRIYQVHLLVGLGQKFRRKEKYETADLIYRAIETVLLPSVVKKCYLARGLIAQCRYNTLENLGKMDEADIMRAKALKYFQKEIDILEKKIRE